MYNPQPIETVSMYQADADEALALAQFVLAMGGVIDTLSNDEGEWRLLARMPRGMWRVPERVMLEASQLELF